MPDPSQELIDTLLEKLKPTQDDGRKAVECGGQFEIALIQVCLIRLGYLPEGVCTGRWSADTATAVAEFLRDCLAGEVIEPPSSQPAAPAEDCLDDQGNVHGIDVSHHQGDIDFRRVRADRRCFVYIKATEGRDGWNHRSCGPGPCARGARGPADAMIRDARKAGVLVGVTALLVCVASSFVSSCLPGRWFLKKPHVRNQIEHTVTWRIVTPPFQDVTVCAHEGGVSARMSEVEAAQAGYVEWEDRTRRTRVLDFDRVFREGALGTTWVTYLNSSSGHSLIVRRAGTPGGEVSIELTATNLRLRAVARPGGGGKTSGMQEQVRQGG